MPVHTNTHHNKTGRQISMEPDPTFNSMSVKSPPMDEVLQVAEMAPSKPREFDNTDDLSPHGWDTPNPPA